MIVDPIPLTGPSIGHREIELAAEAGGLGWNARGRMHVDAFQREVAGRMGQRHGLALASSHAAIFLTLAGLGIKAGDEVLLPEIAEPFLAAAVVHVGATPVFCDVDPVTLCLSPESAARNTTPRTRCIVPSHFFGQPCDMPAIMKLAADKGIPVIENATQGVGATIGDRPAGSFGTFAVVGFEPEYPLVAGGGAVLLCSHDGLMERVARLAGSGMSAANPMVAEINGFYALMSNLQAAVGLAQMERFDEIIQGRRRIFDWYLEELKDVPGIRLNPDVPGTTNSRWMVTCLLEDPAIDRPSFMKRLLASKVVCSPTFYPLSSMPPFRNADNPVARTVGMRALLLPCGHNRTREEIAFVCSAIRQLLADPEIPAADPELTGWLKAKSDALELMARWKAEGHAVPFEHEGASYRLRTVTADEAKSPAYMEEAKALRDAHPEAFLGGPPLTWEQMRKIMEDYGTVSRDFLLIAVEDDSRVWGELALQSFDFVKRTCSLESHMMRDDAPKGLASAAVLAMCGMCRDELGMERLFCNIVGSNHKSRVLASYLGYELQSSVNMRKATLPDGTWTYRPMYIAGRDRAEETLVTLARRLKTTAIQQEGGSDGRTVGAGNPAAVP
ncbi:MAG: GNAT family N-acetyltransferase [Desulfovibrio sp.]|jgi:perosamine synthetase|nr:GNAT family N-acetyltransferase [Desulfovibrio sp.]